MWLSSAFNLHSDHIDNAQLVRVLIRLIFLDVWEKESQLKHNPAKVGFLYTLETKDVEVFSANTSKKDNILNFSREL